MASLVLAGCQAAPGLAPPEDCADEDYFEAEACDEAYCGPPSVEVGAGVSSHEPVGQGDAVPIVYGRQGGFHMDASAQMHNLCPVVWLRLGLDVREPGGDEWTVVFADEAHVQAVRPEPTVSSRQQYWGLRALPPCEVWPDYDPPGKRNVVPPCLDGSEGAELRLDELEVRLRLEAEDHNGRVGGSAVEVDADCCVFLG